MANPGSYQWWRDNYASHPEYQRVCGVLQGYGVDVRECEVDHFPPNAAYTGTHFDTQLAYGARPSLPLPKYLHRFHTGGGGMGGHVSTTGSTFVAKTWTPQLQGMLKAGDFHGAMKQDIIDKRNVALAATMGKDRNLFNALMVPAVRLVHQCGMISDTQCYDLLMDLGAL